MCTYDNRNHLKLFYLWDYGKKAEKRTGISREWESTGRFRACDRLAGDAFATITVNQKASKLCFTRMHFDPVDEGTTPWDAEWDKGQNTRFTAVLK